MEPGEVRWNKVEWNYKHAENLRSMLPYVEFGTTPTVKYYSSELNESWYSELNESWYLSFVLKN
jgi:hypothetical protein